LLCFLRPLVKCLEDLLHEARFQDRAYHLDALVHHVFGDALHLVELRHMNEFGDFDHIGGDMLVFNCQGTCQVQSEMGSIAM
jgi:hypothetical protein